MPTGRNLLASAGAGAVYAAAVFLPPLFLLTVLPPTVATAEPTVTSDEQGYVGTEAHCDSTQLAVAYGRTARSLVAICTQPDGGYEYRGVRVSDEAGLTIDARATSGGFIADNDDATYAVTPQQLLVTSGGKVIYRDTWIEYVQPRFSTQETSAPAG